MDQYESLYPPTPEVPSSLRLFFKTFYKISDTPEAHEKYVGCFTKDAVLVMASAKVEGSDGKEVSSLITNCSTCIPYRKRACSKGLKSRFCIMLYTLLAFDACKTSGILSLRQNMWSAVSSRSHHPTKVFPFAPVSESEAEVMLYGTVEYGFKEGGSDGKDWAARALLVNSSSEGGVGGLGGWRMKFYQVYLVSGVFSYRMIDRSRAR